MKIKIPWIEIILIIAGILFMISGDQSAFYAGIGFIALAVCIFVARLFIGSSKSDPHGQQTSSSSSVPYAPYTPNTSEQPRSKSPPSKSSGNQEARKRQLDDIVSKIRDRGLPLLFSIDDIDSYTDEDLNTDDIEYIAKQLSSEFFSTSIWDLHIKIQSNLLPDDQIVRILDSGTENLVDELMNSYTTSTSWSMSSTLFERLINTKPLLLFRFTNFRKDTLTSMINRLSAYELLGYRMKPIHPGETTENSFIDLKKSTPSNEIFVRSYDSTDTNIIHFLEEHYPDEIELRRIAFTKILTGSGNIIRMIEEIDDITKEEIDQIMKRNIGEEVNALLSRDDSSDIITSLPEDIAIKILLGIVYPDALEEVKDNYSFDDADAFKKVIAELSADQLIGGDDFDIIKIIEDYVSDPNDELRKLAFAKLCQADDISNAIAGWENVNEDEVKVIMQRNIDDEVNELLSRDDSSDIITSLPEDIAIKILLGIVYPDALEEVKDNYSFDDADAFKKVIAELSADQLIGGDDFDIIKIIEDYVSDPNDELRKLAFAKLCQADDISNAIAGWENVNEDEVKVIMQRNIDDEVNELLGRDDSEDIITNLPEDIAIKILLGIVYPDALDEVKDNYSFDDEDAFKKVITELSADQLIGGDEFDIILIIENEMNDDEDLRKLAFAKLCQSDDISGIIPNWSSLTEDEIKVIMERNNDDEVNALLERDDSEEIITNMPDSVIIKKFLLEDIESMNDEFNNRIDDTDFVASIEKTVKKFSLAKLKQSDKDGDVDDLSDELLIKAKLGLFDLDECNFDTDDVDTEYSQRIDDSDFRQKVETLAYMFS